MDANQSIAGDRQATIVAFENPAVREVMMREGELKPVIEPSEEAKKDADEYKKGMDKLKAEDAPKAEDESEHDEEVKKNPKLQERFSELTAKRKAAEAKAEAAEARAAELSEKHAASERLAAELKAKYEPPKPDILGPEPQPSQFTDVNEYSKALKEWTADKVRLDIKKESDERAAKEYKERIEKQWSEGATKAMKEIPDFAETVGKSKVAISPEAELAIKEDENGPYIVYHLAQNPEFADKLNKMSIPAMNREIGKLSAKFAKPASGQQAATMPIGKIAEISKAPAPITPARGQASDAPNLLSSDGTFHGSYQDWKREREAGRIK